jgi:hypothetical protein
VRWVTREHPRTTPLSRGLLAIADGFSYLGPTDQRQLELELPARDALYAGAHREVEQPEIAPRAD